MSDEERERSQAANMRYTEVRPAAYNAKARLDDMDTDGIDLAVLYPTMLLGSAGSRRRLRGRTVPRVQRLALRSHPGGRGPLFGVAVPPTKQDVEASRPRSARRREARHGVGVHAPEPGGRLAPFNDEVYDPLWQAASDTGLPSGSTRSSRPTSRARASAAHQPPVRRRRYADDLAGRRPMEHRQHLLHAGDRQPGRRDDSAAFLTAGGVCERFPAAKFMFLEANGGWLVPWLERLDHHAQEVPVGRAVAAMLPSEYFRRQCWISFDPDESMLAFTANSPLVGADRIVWASDYPHPDAKFPGVTEELREAMTGLTAEQQATIAGEMPGAVSI